MTTASDTGASVVRTGFFDDEPTFLEHMQAWQERVGSPTKASSDPETCLGWVTDGEVDVLICDIVVPGYSGVTLLQEARRLGPDLRLVALTAFEPDEDDERRLNEIGADIYNKREHLSQLLAEFAGPDDEGSALAHIATMREELERLIQYHLEWIRDLVDQLEEVPEPESTLVSITGSEQFTVAELINDIKTRTPRGLKYLERWRGANATIRHARKR